MTASSGGWGWRPVRSQGIWRHGCAWARPFCAAAPWVTLGLLLTLLILVADRLPQASGLLCALPPPVAGQAVSTRLAALVLPGASGGSDASEVPQTLVFFNDARYSLSDEASVALLREHLEARAAAEPSRTLLLLTDQRVPSGDVMKLVALARASGVQQVQMAEKRE